MQFSGTSVNDIAPASTMRGSPPDGSATRATYAAACARPSADESAASSGDAPSASSTSTDVRSS
jgi:hypothetical protein